MDTLFFYFYGSAKEGWGYICKRLGFAFWAPSVYSLHLSHAQLRLLTQRIIPPHHILRQGQHRLKVCLTPGPFYLYQAFWNLISAPFKPLSSTFMTGSSAGSPVSSCSLTPPTPDSVAWDVLAGEVSAQEEHTHRHINTHTSTVSSFWDSMWEQW